jgi:DNA-binding transcriptional regulator YiaG
MNLRFSDTIGRIAHMNGEDLKAFRERLELSQEQLAKELKVASNTVSRWELGTRKIPEYLELALETIERRAEKSKPPKTE